jgi:hypothetical protein
MNRNGLGSKRAKSISSTQTGKRRVADVGPDRIIRHFGASDIKGWYDATQPELSSIANNADVTSWFDKGADQTKLYQATADAKPHYIHSGLNGRPTLRGDGSDDVYRTANAGNAAVNIDWTNTTSVYLLFKATANTTNQGPFGADSGGTAPKSRFGLAAYNQANPDQIRVEVFGTVGANNFNTDNYYNVTGTAGSTPPVLPTAAGQFMLSYYEWQINAGQTGAADTFTMLAYDKEAVSGISPTTRSGFNEDKVITSASNTMAAKGFDADQMRVFQNIHNGFLQGDIGFIMFSNRHYSLKERQMILKAIQQIYGYADIN